MRPHIIIPCLAALAAFAAACSQQEDIPAPPAGGTGVIQFSAFAGRPTRAAATGDVSNENIKEGDFRVYGVKTPASGGQPEAVFTEQEAPEGIAKVTTRVRANADGLWYNDRMTLWETDHTYRFAAVYPASADMEITPGRVGLTRVNGIPAVQEIGNGAEGKSGTDYLLAVTGTLDGAERPEEVRLHFRHILSRLSVSVECADEELEVSLAHLALVTPADGQTVTFTYDEWQAETAEYVEGDGSGNSLDEDEENWDTPADDGTPTDDPATSQTDLAEPPAGYMGSFTYDTFDPATFHHTIGSGEWPEEYTHRILHDEERDGAPLAVTTEPAQLSPEYFIAPGGAPLYIEVTYTVSMPGHQSRTLTQWADLSSTFEPKSGHSQNLRVILANGRIRFDVTEVADWAEARPATPVTPDTLTWVDMGPAGKWATNDILDTEGVGCGRRYEYGQDICPGAGFAWGSVEMYSYRSNFGPELFNRHTDGNRLDPAYDPATYHCGAGWRTPTDEEWATLADPERYLWRIESRVSGYSTSNFVSVTCTVPGPAYGNRIYFNMENDPIGLYYWTSTTAHPEEDEEYGYEPLFQYVFGDSREYDPEAGDEQFLAEMAVDWSGATIVFDIRETKAYMYSIQQNGPASCAARQVIAFRTVTSRIRPVRVN